MRTDSFFIPDSFAATTRSVHGDTGTAWLHHLPKIIAACAQKWSLVEITPLAELSFNFVAMAARADGARVVLKIGVPHAELFGEMDALAAYGGAGCAKLLATDRENGAFLLENLSPGTPLAALEDDDRATEIAAGVLRNLFRPAPAPNSFRTVADWGAGFARARRAFAAGESPLLPEIVAHAESMFAELHASAGEIGLLHGDLHHWNILRAERSPWLAIDPKGILGEMAYDTGVFLRNFPPHLRAHPAPKKRISRRADIFAAELGISRRRILRWAFAQTVLSAWWCIEDGVGDWRGTLELAGMMERI